MNKKLIIRYILLGLPFVLGIVLYGVGIFNIISSFLFFGGGYVFIKNICDYRKINKNIKLSLDDSNTKFNSVYNDKIISKDISVIKENDLNKYRSCDSISGLKSNRRYIKVRRRIK